MIYFKMFQEKTNEGEGTKITFTAGTHGDVNLFWLLYQKKKKKGKTLIIMILGLWESGSPKERLFDHMGRKRDKEKQLNGLEHVRMPGRYLHVVSGAAILLSTLSYL
jgi:hypothetical protein